MWEGYIGLGFRDENFLAKLPKRKASEPAPADPSEQLSRQQELEQSTAELKRHL